MYPLQSIHILVFYSLLTAASSSDPCDNKMCVHGDYVPQGTSYRCECYERFVSRCCIVLRSSTVNCDVDGPFKCLHGGFCNATDNKFMCICLAGFKGHFCEVVNECLSSQCRNGATCINRPGGDFFCLCPHGFAGSLCEDQTEVCSASTCFNGGTCIDGDKGYVCSCPFGYIGGHCQHKRHSFAPKISITNGVCVGCPAKAGNGRCDEECDRVECGFDSGECSSDPHLFKTCRFADYCARVFRDGVCDEVQQCSLCDNEACLFDGFDCRADERKCFDHCGTKKRDGLCDEECNTRECGFDGGDCRKAPENILTGELSIIISSRPGCLVAKIRRFLRWLSNILHADARIKRDEDGLVIFQWKDGEVGRRVTTGNKVTFEQEPSLESILARIEIDVSQCKEKCFSNVEVVASFIAAAKGELEGTNINIYSGVVENPKHLLVTMACVALMVAVALIFIVHQHGSRKRNVNGEVALFIFVD